MPCKNYLFKIIFTIVLLSYPLVFGQETGKVYSTSSGEVSFRSDAPQEIIRANSKRLYGLIDAGQKTFTFRILLRSFEGFNSQLQREHFNEKYLESEKFPEAHFSGKIIEDIDINREGVYTVRAKGRFTIHGISRERIIKARIENRNGTLILNTAFSILLSEHQIKVPRVVHDKIASEISVEVHSVLKKQK